MKKVLFSRGARVELRRPGRHETEALRFKSHEHALAFLRTIAHEPLAAQKLRAFAREEFGRWYDPRHSDTRVLELLARRVAAGFAELVRTVPTPVAVGVVQEREERERVDELPALVPLTWIEVELLDSAGKPVPNATYQVKLTDNTVRTGRLDPSARVHFGNLEAGECEITWPGLDKTVVSATPIAEFPPSGMAPRYVPKHWIEIELVTSNGRPVRDEPYWIQLPDGTTHEGRLDARGRAYFGGLDEGVGEIRWPELDGDVGWSKLEDEIPPARETPRYAPRHWVEIELVASNGRPVPGEPYVIKLPDGSTHEGALDARGRAYFGDLDEGECEITWPALDHTVARGQPETEIPPARETPRYVPRHWIEVELLSSNGRPAAGETYEVKLPDGTTHKGMLDSRGRAYFPDLDKGQGEVHWPALGRDVLRTERQTEAAIPRETPRYVPRHWVEVELLASNGRPAAGERYEVKLPDGTTHQGNLDTHGRAYFPDLEKGDGAVHWPALGRDVLRTGREPETAIARETPRYVPRHWVEVELLASNGRPAAGEQYEVKLPDGSTHQGSLDTHGRAYFPDLEKGDGEVHWPALGRDLLRTGREPETAIAREIPRYVRRGWIEIELVGSNGRPAAGERYWIKLTDGSVREGTLDARGRAYFADMEPGECEIRWPDLDRGVQSVERVREETIARETPRYVRGAAARP